MKTSQGRRKQLLSLVDYNTNPTSDSPPDPLVEETELETFQHFLDDGDWVTVEEHLPTHIGGSERKKKKVSYATYSEVKSTT